MVKRGMWTVLSTSTNNILNNDVATFCVTISDRKQLAVKSRAVAWMSTPLWKNNKKMRKIKRCHVMFQTSSSFILAMSSFGPLLFQRNAVQRDGMGTLENWPCMPYMIGVMTILWLQMLYTSTLLSVSSQLVLYLAFAPSWVYLEHLLKLKY
jgi:hypothetical protein